MVSHNSVYGSSGGGFGGGVYCDQGGIVENCTISANSAEPADSEGGGVLCDKGGIVRNCLIVGNFAVADSGGIACWNAGPIVQNCTIVSNAAESGGGIELWNGGQIENCIIYFNTADDGSNYWMNVTNLHYTCTTPIIPGEGNITNEPEFVNAGAGNFRLSELSPCINNGTNMSWMSGGTDLDGKPRIIDNVVDMGTYEFAPYPIISVTPLILDFGFVVILDETNVSTSVRNLGDGVLTGEVYGAALPFIFAAGSPTSYFLGYLDTTNIMFKFAPTEVGETNIVVTFTGGGGTNAVLMGAGVPEPFLFINCYLLFIIYYWRKLISFLTFNF